MFCEPYIPLLASGTLPQPLTCLFDAEFLSLPYTALLDKCEDIYCSYFMTDAQAKAVEEATRSVKIKNLVSAKGW